MLQKIHDGCTIQTRPNVGFWLCPSGSAGIILAGSWVLMLCRSMVRCRCMGFSMVRCQGQSGGTYELPRSVHRARNASDCCAFVTFEDARCQMHCNALLCGSWDPHILDSAHDFSPIKCCSRTLKMKPRVVDYFGNLRRLFWKLTIS